MNRRTNKPSRQWRQMDLHIHTPASNDYQEPGVSYLDILQRAEARGLDLISFTDHNTVAGYRKMREEIDQLEMLEKLKRLEKDEAFRLKEYRRLLDKIKVLPGFEFTASFGFHILAIFPEVKSLREIEHLLLNLNIPPDELDNGSSTVGASSDVLTAYQMIDEAGGMAIAAHANSTNGVAMRGFGFGGQTKIAFTQDPHLYALEVTDLGQGGRRSTAAFFNGTKPEYPRRMHCIQGSDAHRLRTDPKNKKHLGVGDRTTKVLISDVSFESLRDLFRSNDFARSRPHWPSSNEEFDFVAQAREEGSTIIQDFHESMTVRGGRLYAVIADICAFANTNGGTLYIGVEADNSKPPTGVAKPASAVQQLQKELSNRISPPLNCTIDIQTILDTKVLRVLVPRGDDPPYAVDDNKIYVRDEADTGLAVRDEIVQLVLRGKSQPTPILTIQEEQKQPVENGMAPPRTGVEVVAHEERDGVRYYTMRDLRNGNVVKNVTMKSARRLWHYAISQYTNLPADTATMKIAWKGDLAILREQSRGKGRRFDLAQKSAAGPRFYFGVTEDGIHGEWKQLVGNDVE
ncbi:MAG: putative DNA binding domain-containing protein [Anaerolineales bacterium]|nr:putative DNA binding domain-containing protein [Anaerolineales bacterium]